MSRTFACADLHGRYDLWRKIKDFLRRDDKVIFLGDAIDRGPDGYKLMKELLVDSQVIYLKGNHELLMQEALEELRDSDGVPGDKFWLWHYNGCMPTYEAWQQSGGHYGIIKFLKELNLWCEYSNIYGYKIFLSHAGFTPPIINIENEQDFLWNRRHFFGKIDSDRQIVVHGHTPISTLEKIIKDYDKDYTYTLEPGILIYEQYKKYDIDCGSWHTGKASLLNLDNLHVKVFTEDD